MRLVAQLVLAPLHPRPSPPRRDGSNPPTRHPSTSPLQMQVRERGCRPRRPCMAIVKLVLARVVLGCWELRTALCRVPAAPAWRLSRLCWSMSSSVVGSCSRFCAVPCLPLAYSRRDNHGGAVRRHGLSKVATANPRLQQHKHTWVSACTAQVPAVARAWVSRGRGSLTDSHHRLSVKGSWSTYVDPCVGLAAHAGLEVAHAGPLCGGPCRSQTNAGAKGSGSVVSHVSVSSHVDKPMHLPNITMDKPGVLVVEKAAYPGAGGGAGAAGSGAAGAPTSLLPTGAVLRGQITDKCVSCFWSATEHNLTVMGRGLGVVGDCRTAFKFAVVYVWCSSSIQISCRNTVWCT